MQPNATLDEWHEADAMLRRDSRVIAALADRGITDIDRVLFDTWTYGHALVPQRASRAPDGLGGCLAPGQPMAAIRTPTRSMACTRWWT